MKFLRLLFVPIITAALGASLMAQTTPSTPAATPVEVSRIAYINSEAFADQATGIKTLARVMQQLELEFSGTQSDLSLMDERLRTIAAEINKLNANPTDNAQALQEKQTAGLKLQQELQGKQREAQAAFSKRQQETQVPVTVEIGKALRVFSNERNISMLFDVAKLGDALIDAKPELDLTADFIGYYNAKNP